MSKIWFQDFNIEQIEALSKNTMMEHLDIHYTDITENSISATMPVDQRTHQPMGMLHGGASVVLAESLGSIAGSLCVDHKKFYCVGIEINANHIRPVKKGFVKGVTKPVHIGSTTQIWEISIYNEQEKLVCISRLTLAVVKI